MRRNLCGLKVVALLFLLSSFARADYAATGEIKGWESSFFGFILTIKHIDAVRGADGKLYSVATRFAEVTEYDGSSNGQHICHIRITSGLIGKVMSVISNKPVFYEKQADGKYKEIDIDDLFFPCVKI